MRDEANPPISACRTLAGSAPALRREQQGLADRLDGQGDDDLVGDLGGLAGADIADQGDVLAHQIEQRLDPVEGRLGPPTMIVSEAALAPTSPPETGAST